jgi:citronellol/citronellal dehydrogenase
MNVSETEAVLQTEAEPQTETVTQTLPAGAAFAGRTVFMSGGSRGIGLAIALRLAAEGANVALMAKTDQPHPKLEGTVHTAAAEIEAAGGQALAIVGDVRDDHAVAAAVESTAARFGGIDIVINNASAIALLNTEQLSMSRYDLMQDINVRGSFSVVKHCLPELRNGINPHILTLSPPLELRPEWFGGHVAYTLSKYGMSMLTLGWSEELRETGVAANALWPRTLIATAAVQNLLGGEEAMAKARTPRIVADAAREILVRPARECSGNFFIDDEVLAAAGITELDEYRAGPGDAELALDLFVAERDA